MLCLVVVLHQNWTPFARSALTIWVRMISLDPSATQVRVRLVRSGGDVAQEVMLPLLGGRVAPSTLRAGNAVRDEEQLVVDPRLSAETMSVEVSLGSASTALGRVKLSGRAHTFDTSGTAPLATFGGAMDLIGADVAPRSARAGDKVTVHLRSRSALDNSQPPTISLAASSTAGEGCACALTPPKPIPSRMRRIARRMLKSDLVVAPNP